jgi:hypothetical protein
MSSTNKYLMIGTAVVLAGAAAWYLSKDQDAIAYDPKKHTIEELRKIVHELFVEGATLYCQKLNMIKNLKTSNELTDDVMENMKTRQKQEMDEAEQSIYEEYGYDEFFVQDWLQRVGKDAIIDAEFEKLRQIEKEVFDEKNARIEHIIC